MKRILSFILALVMFASCATVAMAADFEFEFALLDSEQENEVTEVNVGEQVYLIISSSTKTDVYGIELNFDTTAFEIATIEDEGELYPAVFGDHNDAVVFNPEGQENVISVGGMKQGLKKAIEAQVGLIAKKAGTYEISFKGQRDKDMPDGASSTAANSLTLTVKGGDPYALETSYVAAAENVTVTNPAVEKPYEVKTALIFGSSINTGSAANFGTEITLKGWTGDPIVIPAAHTYDAGAGKTGFVAAVTSIREANLGVDFIAKAYAEKEDYTKVYGEEKTANFNSLIKPAAE